jgi:hypothetical protein
VNLGFVSFFFKIPTQQPSIYRGFGLLISCTCRALSPSSQIRLGFDISFDFVEISTGGVSVSVTTWHGVGDAGAEPLLGRARVRPGQAHLGCLGQIRPMAK